MTWDKNKTQMPLENEEEVKPQTFTVDDVEQELKELETTQKTAKVRTHSPLCCVLYGLDGTAKTGITLDSRTEEQKKAHKKVYILDLDESAAIVKYAYWADDDDIVIIDPVVLGEDHKKDYVSTYNKLAAYVHLLKKKDVAGEIATVSLDGLDTFLKDCEMVMRYQDLKIAPDKRITNSWDWGKRNIHYYNIVFLLKRFSCNRFFTTHLKPIKKFSETRNELITLKYEPNWQSEFPGKMAQRILCQRNPNEETGEVVFEALIEKSKGALHLEGKIFPIAIVKENKTEWLGLHAYFDEVYKATEKGRQDGEKGPANT